MSYKLIIFFVKIAGKGVQCKLADSLEGLPIISASLFDQNDLSKYAENKNALYKMFETNSDFESQFYTWRQ